MALRARSILVLLVLVVAGVAAGCVSAPSSRLDPSGAAPEASLGDVRAVSVANVMTFGKAIVTPAIALSNDLYEPTMEVSDTGAIYVAAHVVGAATTGTPAWYSRDDGKTWAQLPFLGPVSSPAPTGAQPPPGDEGFIVAGEKGQAWMADIYAAGFAVTGWCDNGASQCYDNRQAYDRPGSIQAECDAKQSLNDRPWAAYGGGKLLLVNNPGGGPMQLGVMDVPPAQPVGILGGAASAGGPKWNFCASPGGSIPGVPAMRPDGMFAVPQMSTLSEGKDNVLTVVIGNAKDIMKTQTIQLFPVTNVGPGTTNGGRSAFDKNGTLYVGARNNTAGNTTTGTDITGQTFQTVEPRDGQFILAVSTDNGETFVNRTFHVSSPMQSMYLDGNMAGPGALLTWSQQGTAKDKADWYVAHVFVGADGAPEVRDVTLALDEGPQYAAHVMGAAAGPDGRAYFVTFTDNAATGYTGSTPLTVWVQKDGVKLPVTS